MIKEEITMCVYSMHIYGRALHLGFACIADMVAQNLDL